MIRQPKPAARLRTSCHAIQEAGHRTTATVVRLKALRREVLPQPVLDALDDLIPRIEETGKALTRQCRDLHIVYDELEQYNSKAKP